MIDVVVMMVMMGKAVGGVGGKGVMKGGIKYEV